MLDLKIFVFDVGMFNLVSACYYLFFHVDSVCVLVFDVLLDETNIFYIGVLK